MEAVDFKNHENDNTVRAFGKYKIEMILSYVTTYTSFIFIIKIRPLDTATKTQGYHSGKILIPQASRKKIKYIGQGLKICKFHMPYRADKNVCSFEICTTWHLPKQLSLELIVQVLSPHIKIDISKRELRQGYDDSPSTKKSKYFPPDVHLTCLNIHALSAF